MINCKENAKDVNEKPSRLPGFVTLFIIGFFMVFLGIIVLMVAAVCFSDSASFGGVIFIGPIPIVVGVGPEASWMVPFAIILAILTVVMFLVLRREMKKITV